MSDNTEQNSPTTQETHEGEAPATSSPLAKPRVTPAGVRPSALKKVSARPQASAAPVLAPSVPDDAQALAQAREFGRVDDDGTVSVVDGEDTRVVGQMPDNTAEEALTFYARRYVDLVAKVALFEARLHHADLGIKEIDSTVAKLAEETQSPAAVGNLAALRDRVAALTSAAAQRRSELDAQRAAAKEEALAQRTVIVERAEKIAGTDPAKIQWRPAGEELRTLLEQWKEAQRQGPRLDKVQEDALWKRFSHARTAFDRERRHYFSELEKLNAAAKEKKTALVARAQALSTSEDFANTAAAYRDLMTEWKAAGRANRKDDDALWAQFRAAQDAFFARRDEANAVLNQEFEANLAVKEALLERAEKLVPVTDIASAKAQLRTIQDEWEAAGKVPRADVQRVEGRLRAVERAIKDAEQAQWDRSNPETKARAEGALAQLEQGIHQLEEDLAAAQTAGNNKKVKELTDALAARTAWLEQIRRAAEEA